jgi:hypothetical protein
VTIPIPSSSRLPKRSPAPARAQLFVHPQKQSFTDHITMFSLRSFARSAPRSIARLAARSTRQRLARSPAVFQLRTQPSSISRGTAFSTSASRRQGNEELVAKLESEYNIEKDMRDEDNYNQTIREFVDNSPFDVRPPVFRTMVLEIRGAPISIRFPRIWK